MRLEIMELPLNPVLERNRRQVIRDCLSLIIILDQWRMIRKREHPRLDIVRRKIGDTGSIGRGKRRKGSQRAKWKMSSGKSTSRMSRVVGQG